MDALNAVSLVAYAVAVVLYLAFHAGLRAPLARAGLRIDMRAAAWSPDRPPAAFVAGLAGSAHCVAMCGGLAGALAMRAGRADDARSRLTLAFVYNVSRITSYAIAGALAGALGAALVRTVDAAWLSVCLRVVAAIVMVAAAGRIAFATWRPASWMGRARGRSRRTPA